MSDFSISQNKISSSDDLSGKNEIYVKRSLNLQNNNLEQTRSPLIIPSIYYGLRDTEKQKNEMHFGVGAKIFVPYKNFDISVGTGFSRSKNSTNQDVGIDMSYNFPRGARISTGIYNYGQSFGYSSGRIFVGANMFGPAIKYRLPFIPIGPGFGDFTVGASPSVLSAGYFSTSGFSPLAAAVISFLEAFKSSRVINSTSYKLAEISEQYKNSENPNDKALLRYMHDFFLLEKASYERNWIKNSAKIPLLNLLTMFGGSRFNEVSDELSKNTLKIINNVKTVFNQKSIFEKLFDKIPNNLPEEAKKLNVFSEILPEFNNSSIQENEIEMALRNKLIEDSLYLAYRGFTKDGTNKEARKNIVLLLSSAPNEIKTLVKESLQNLPDQIKQAAQQCIKVETHTNSKRKKINMSGENYILLSLSGESIADLLAIEKEVNKRIKTKNLTIESLIDELKTALEVDNRDKIYEASLCLFELARKSPKIAGNIALALEQLSTLEREKLINFKEKIADYLNNRSPDILRTFGMGKTKVKAILPNGKVWNFDIDDYVKSSIDGKISELGKILETEDLALKEFKDITKGIKHRKEAIIEKTFDDMVAAIDSKDKIAVYRHAILLFLIAQSSPKAARLVSEKFLSLNLEQREFVASLTDLIIDFCQSRQNRFLSDIGFIRKVRFEDCKTNKVIKLDKYFYIEQTITGQIFNLNNKTSSHSNGDNDPLQDKLLKTFLPNYDNSL